MRTPAFLTCLVILCACPAPDPQSDDEADTDTDSTEGTDTTTGGADDQHGTVKIEVVAEDPANPPFAGTAEIVATVLYQDCLIGFYQVEHPELQQDGVEGAAVFADWVDRLCDPGLERAVACEVTEIDQTLIDDTAVYQLRVTFAITDPASIADNWLYVGPLPTQTLVGATCDTPPQVELRANGLIGRDGEGAQLWSIKTLPGNNQASTDQGAPLRVTVGF